MKVEIVKIPLEEIRLLPAKLPEMIDHHAEELKATHDAIWVKRRQDELKGLMNGHHPLGVAPDDDPVTDLIFVTRWQLMEAIMSLAAPNSPGYPRPLLVAVLAGAESCLKMLEALLAAYDKCGRDKN